MKTTLEIPDAIFRRAKARAAEQRIPLRQFVSEAVAEKLEASLSRFNMLCFSRACKGLGR